MAPPDATAADPALRLSFAQASGRAIALQAAGTVLLLHGVVHDSLFAPYMIARGVAAALGAALAGLVLGPVATRSPSAGGAAGRALGLSGAGGAVAALFATPFVAMSVTWARPRTPAEIVLGQVQEGVFLGFVIGISFAATAALHQRIRAAGALDFAPRLLAVACAALISPCVVVGMIGGIQRVIAPLIVAAGAAALAGRARRRRVDWLARVTQGEEQGYRVEEVRDGDSTEGLPAFSGDQARGWHVLLRAAGPSTSDVHPFRAGEAWVAAAHVDPESDAIEGREAMRRAAVRGALAGLVLVVVVGLPLALLARPHGG